MTTRKSKTTKTVANTKRATPAPTKKLSQIDAAVQVLGKSKEPMNCKALVEAMAKQGLWTSPGGATPDATLYASILREINTQGKASRFKKVERGQFALTSTIPGPRGTVKADSEQQQRAAGAKSLYSFKSLTSWP